MISRINLGLIPHKSHRIYLIQRKKSYSCGICRVYSIRYNWCVWISGYEESRHRPNCLYIQWSCMTFHGITETIVNSTAKFKYSRIWKRANLRNAVKFHISIKFHKIKSSMLAKSQRSMFYSNHKSGVLACVLLTRTLNVVIAVGNGICGL